MDAHANIAVAGATGRVGHHVVDVLQERGYDVVPMSRATGVDVVTGAGLAEALAGVDAIVDAATGPSPEQDAATRFFTASARNLQAAGARAGVGRLVAVSIIGADRFSGGYGAAKIAHEQATLAGPIPARIVRASQFHAWTSSSAGAARATSATCRRCERSSSRPAPPARRWRTSLQARTPSSPREPPA